MKIKLYKKLKFNRYNYYPCDPTHQNSLLFIYFLLHDGFADIHQPGVQIFLENNKGGIMFENVELSFDDKNNTAYLSEPSDKISQSANPAINRLIETKSIPYLCSVNSIDHIAMTKNNLYHILYTWEQFIHHKSPFALLYQDDTGQYDIKAFDSQTAMQSFIADQQS